MSYRLDQFYNWANFEKSDPRVRSKGGNPPFALHDYDQRLPGAPKMARGYLRPMQTSTNGIRFHFLFNPNQISRSFSVSTELEDPSFLSEEAKTVVGFAMQDFGFAVYLDRQLEVATAISSGDPAATAKDRGVIADIEVLDTMFGAGGQAIASGADSVGVTNGGNYNATILSMRPFYVVFSSLLTAAGTISGVSIDMMKFNSAMVPTVATVNISMRAFYFGRGVNSETLQKGFTASGSANVGVGTAAAGSGFQSGTDVEVVGVGSSTGRYVR